MSATIASFQTNFNNWLTRQYEQNPENQVYTLSYGSGVNKQVYTLEHPLPPRIDSTRVVNGEEKPIRKLPNFDVGDYVKLKEIYTDLTRDYKIACAKKITPNIVLATKNHATNLRIQDHKRAVMKQAIKKSVDDANKLQLDDGPLAYLLNAPTDDPGLYVENKVIEELASCVFPSTQLRHKKKRGPNLRQIPIKKPVSYPTHALQDDCVDDYEDDYCDDYDDYGDVYIPEAQQPAQPAHLLGYVDNYEGDEIPTATEGVNADPVKE